jgi:tripartite-type tricarboxylate transporter receptor subunit TctC
MMHGRAEAALRALVAALPLVCAANAGAQAQSWPSAPVRFLIPFAPGAGNDLLSRKIGQLLSESLKQPVIMENQAGAGGIIATQQLARSTPNGYTIAMGSPSTLSIAPYMMKEAPYDPIRDIAPVALIATAPFVVIVNNKLPVATLVELIAYAKANKGKLNFASAGTGTTIHLGGEVLNSMAGVDFQHIPFKGGGPAITAVMAGDVEMFLAPILQAAPLVQQKQVKGLAITALQRSPILPDLPTVAESYPGYQCINWYGIVAPAKTPPAIIDRLNREIVKLLGTPELRTQLNNDGAQVAGGTPQEFSELIRNESERYRGIIKALKLTSP